MPIYVDYAVEGLPDAVVAARLIAAAGMEPGRSFIAWGKASLLRRLSGFNNSARFSPWLVIIDQDDEGPCPGALVDRLLPSRGRHLFLRIAVREVESWILADRRGIAAFFGVPASVVPGEPDRLEDPKAAVVGLARRSPKRDLRDAIVPASIAPRLVGPQYPATLAQFAEDQWSATDAAERSPSLARALDRLQAYRTANAP
jgi:hypothetical protein